MEPTPRAGVIVTARGAAHRQSVDRAKKMPDPNKGRIVIQNLKKQLRRGDPIAAYNIAATYRELGNNRRAFHWWQRTAGLDSGNAWLEVGYRLQYGIGTRRDAAAAIKAYRRAIASHHTTEYACEEAQYHLAGAWPVAWVARPTAHSIEVPGREGRSNLKLEPTLIGAVS